MSNRVFGYVRVSTKNQCEDRQLIAMREYGVPERNIVVEKQSGKDFDRPRYQKLMHRLKRGDTLIVKSLDRLGRDYLEIQEQWRIISKEKGVAIIVLDMPLLNTKEHAELIGQLITDLVLQLFSFVAQTERENIHKRQREGIEAARARGVRFGRPRLAMPESFAEVVKQWRNGEFNAQEAAHRLGISRTTFFRRVRELERMRNAERIKSTQDANTLMLMATNKDIPAAAYSASANNGTNDKTTIAVRDIENASASKLLDRPQRCMRRAHAVCNERLPLSIYHRLP